MGSLGERPWCLLKRAGGGMTLQQWLTHWSVWSASPQKMDGPMKAARLDRKAFSNGQLSMRSGSEWRSGAVAVSLWQILETGPVDRRYFLSPKACEGILRRAEKRGKALPEQLRRALAEVVGREHPQRHSPSKVDLFL